MGDFGELMRAVRPVAVLVPLLAAVPAMAAAPTQTSGTVNGLAADIWTWTDSSGQPRTIALKKEGAGNPGHGGYAIQATYYRRYWTTAQASTWQLVTVNAPAGDGFGYFVSHERSRYFGTDSHGNPIVRTIADYIFGKDDSPLGLGFAATTSIPLATATAAAERFTISYGHYGTIAPGGIDLNTGYDSPPLTNTASRFTYYTIPVTTTWVFQQGTDYPRIDVSVDLSRVIPPGGTTPTANLVSFDMRGPYGVFLFDNSANRVVNSVVWGDQAYRFTTQQTPATRSSPWTWSASNAGARYHGLTANGGSAATDGPYEIGLFEPVPASASALADGYAPERGQTSTSYAALVARGQAWASQDSCSPGHSQTLPTDGEWPYQSLQYSLPCPSYGANYLTAPAYGKKIAWGSSMFYGTSLGWVWNGVASFPINAWPASHRLAYGVCLVLAWDSPLYPPAGGTTVATAAAAYTRATPVPAKPNCSTTAVP